MLTIHVLPGACGTRLCSIRHQSSQVPRFCDQPQRCVSQHSCRSERIAGMPRIQEQRWSRSACMAVCYRQLPFILKMQHLGGFRPEGGSVALSVWVLLRELHHVDSDVSPTLEEVIGRRMYISACQGTAARQHRRARSLASHFERRRLHQAPFDAGHCFSSQIASRAQDGLRVSACPFRLQALHGTL